LNSDAMSILSIPVEILSAIFELSKTMANEDSLSLAYEGPKMVPEIIYSQICIGLRNVALTTPRLWTSIYIDAAVSSAERIPEYIRRSGVCLLDIRVDLAAEDAYAGKSGLDSMIDLIVDNSLRWRSVSAECTCERADRPIMTHICKSTARRLQHLSLDIEDVEQADPSAVNREIGFPHIFKDGAPKLKFVRLKGLAIQFFRPPFDAVVTLHLEQTSQVPLAYITFRNIITRSSVLAHLSIHGDIIDNISWSRFTDVIILPHLLSLRICGEGGNIYSGLLMGIKAPLLKSLTLKDVQEHDLDAMFDSTSSSQYNNLRQLVFTNFELSGSTYRRIFHTFREITSFSSVQSSIAESPLIDTLVKDTSQGQTNYSAFWPNLAVLAFSFGDDEVDEEMIQELRNVRASHGLPLPKIRLRVEPDEMQDATAMVRGDINTAIEIFFQDEAWPPNCDHIDSDDVLFSW
ncbi:hypothetical protein CPB84DRAFT_1692408, partial [Gymnopilus junonius]